MRGKRALKTKMLLRERRLQNTARGQIHRLMSVYRKLLLGELKDYMSARLRVFLKRYPTFNSFYRSMV